MFEGENVTKKLAIAFGAVLLFVGILGFVPAVTPNGLLLGIFAVDTEHNVIHLVSGAAAIIAGLGTYRAARTFFQVFGVLYGLVAVFGFTVHPHAGGTDQLFGLIAINMADNLLHVAISLFALFMGFAARHGTPSRRRN